MARFKLLVGRHVHGKVDNPVPGGKKVPVVYHADGSGAGNVIDTDVDLTELNSSDPNMRKKFERIYEDERAVKQAVAAKPAKKPKTTDVTLEDLQDLDSMSKADLASLAEDLELDTSSSRTKADLIALVREHLSEEGDS